KTLQEDKSQQNSDTFEYIPEEPPVFADDIQFDSSVINSISETKNTPPVKKSIDKISLQKSAQNNKDSKNTQPKAEIVTVNDNPLVEGEYVKPPVTLLEPQPEEDGRNISLELHQNGTMLVDTLKSFGVQTTIVNISRGPSVTRYELQPAAGVKISKITNLADDIAMNLAATGVRIEAPIPGKSAVGIEVPNKNVNIVRMRNLIESQEFNKAKSKLTVALGYDITGKIILADLAKMPHLLIAGSTGSGKSVCINSMLVSLLYKANPDEVKLVLIDPKVVELGVYNGIPHLYLPVVTDPRKAAGTLNWAVDEMLKRYKTFAEYNVRDMQSYNRLVDRKNSETDENDANIVDDSERSFEEDEMLAQAQSEIANYSENTERPKKLEKMPQIVIVIDELADLMMAAPNEVEESICRLAQMARAAGMHLVIATQRPSVDVITGLIKANVPSRIAFAVKSQIDSRTILDGGGAEKLLGRGDMLFSPIGTTKPIRVQGCYVDDTEVENIVEFIKKSRAVEYDDNIIAEIEKKTIAENVKSSSDSSDENVDPVMEDAIKCVVEAGQASTSLLQRRLRLGYARAGRLIDEMEQMGIVGPHEGSKPRQVLMTHQQWLERNMMRSDDNN
ncbi:MAG: DNA translocase FtsK, partial [Acutalibacteraceae bacterium]